MDEMRYIGLTAKDYDLFQICLGIITHDVLSKSEGPEDHPTRIFQRRVMDLVTRLSDTMTNLKEELPTPTPPPHPKKFKLPAKKKRGDGKPNGSDQTVVPSRFRMQEVEEDSDE